MDSALERIGTFARLAAATLADRIGATAVIRVVSTDQVTLGELLAAPSGPGAAATVFMDPLEGAVLLHLESAVALVVLERLLGGAGTGGGTVRDLTDIERSVLDGVFSGFLGDLCTAWSDVPDLNPRLAGAEDGSRAVPRAADTEMTIRAALEVKCLDAVGSMVFAVPCRIMRASLPKPAARETTDGAAGIAELREALHALDQKVTALAWPQEAEEGPMENALRVSMARPRDAARLLRTWLLAPDAAENAGERGSALSGRRKAAMFLVILGPEASAGIYRHLGEDEIEVLTFEIARLEYVGGAERDAVLTEFHGLLVARDFTSAGGVDCAREILEKSLGARKALEVINHLIGSLQAPPFDFLKRADPALIPDLVRSEHPQTIAVILAGMEPREASLLLGSLPAGIQPDVVKRIATMGRPSTDALGDVERVLERKLSALSPGDRAAMGGVPRSAEILDALDGSTGRSILERLEGDDPELADGIKQRMFVFEDILLLEDRAVQKALRELDAAELARALKGAEGEVREKVLKNMSRRASTLLREDMDSLGSIRRVDVEEARAKVVQVIRKLEERGEIVVARGGSAGAAETAALPSDP